MREIMKTNDAVLLSFAEALLKDAAIPTVVLDANMSVLEGSLGVLPRRLAVEDDRWVQARRVLAEAGLTQWIGDDDRG